MKHHHSHIALLTIALSVTLFVYVLYGYMRYHVDVSLDRALSARDLAASEEINKRELGELDQKFQATAAARARLPSFFVSDGATLAFIESIESLGQRVGSTVTLSSLSADPLEGAAPGTLGYIRVHVEAVGSWQAVLRTLMLAEVLPYKASVSQVRLDSNATVGEKAAPAWRVSFVVEAALIHQSN